MRTDELIRSLVADGQASPRPPAMRLLPFVLAGAAVSVVGFLVVLGPRSDISTAARTLRFDLKILVSLTLLAAAVLLVMRMARPGAATRFAAAGLFVAPLLLGLAVAAEMMALPRASWLPAALGANWLVCLTAMPLLSLPMLAGTIYALRSGASLRPVLTGAIAGVLAAAAAAALYALHCTDDSPLFVAIWYSLAIAAVAVAGALAGRFALRW